MHSCLTPATCVWKVTVFLGPVGVLVTYLLKLASSRRRGGGQHSSTTRGLRPPEQLERPAGFPSLHTLFRDRRF